MVVITLVVELLIGFLLDDVIVNNIMIVDSNIMPIKDNTLDYVNVYKYNSSYSVHY